MAGSEDELVGDARAGRRTAPDQLVGAPADSAPAASGRRPWVDAIRSRWSPAAVGTDPSERTDAGAHGERFPAIEGVRAFAALAIVAYHVGELGGTTGQLARFGDRLTIGVPVFFVVSAFVLYRPYVARRVSERPTPPIGPFWLRRVARIVPLYWVTLTFVWATCPLFSAQTRTQLFDGVPAWRYYLFLQVYDERSSLSGLSPAWSLNVEMAFYLVLPIWAVGAAWLVRRRVPVHLELVVLATIVVAGLPYLRDLEQEASYLSRTPLANAAYFAIGMALAVLSVDLRTRSRPMVVSRLVRLVVPVAPLAIAAILALFLLAEEIPRYDLFSWALVALVLLPSAFDERAMTWTKRILLNRHIQLVGVLSYGVYLFHRQIALGLRLWFWAPMGQGGFLVALAAVVALTVLVAQVSYRYLEQPVIRRARTVGRPPALERTTGTAP